MSNFVTLVRRGRLLPIVAVFVVIFAIGVQSAQSASWPMKQRDICNTGRADFVVPASRQNDHFFDIIVWQTPSPGSPNEGNFSSTQMTFFDGVGPGNCDVVVGGYHWPKGVQAMNRQNGARLWYGNPEGGESIGVITPAFSPNGRTIYVTNDATSHQLMAFSTSTGPSSYWHNGGDPYAGVMGSPRIAPDGRIFVHQWSDRPYGFTDSGTSLSSTWVAASWTADCLSEPALYQDGGTLKVIAAGRFNRVYCFDGSTGAEIWSVGTAAGTDGAPTVDPANGNIYVACGWDSVYVVGLTKNGAQLWDAVSKRVFEWQNGVNSPQRVSSPGCLSHDGSTYYFQTVSTSGTGALYAINTFDGSIKWIYDTWSTGGEAVASAPIVTPNGIIIVGNNEGGMYYALRDDGTQATLIDSLGVEWGGNARASATLAPDGKLYLPLRTIWTAPNAGGGTPTFDVANVYTCFDLNEGASQPLAPPSGQGCVALNRSCRVTWKPIVDPSGRFHHYAIYRATSPFTSVAGKTPIGTVNNINAVSYLDVGLTNGTKYYYAVTSVTTDGAEYKDVVSVGPRTPRDETDLQVVSVARTPIYPRYWANYTYYSITEPSGFGPYVFSASTSLGGGQNANTKRWPDIGETTTYTATVRNRGTNTWSGTLSATWKVDGTVVSTPSKSVSLAPGDIVTFTINRTWDNLSHDITFQINVTDARSANNTLTTNSKSVAFLTYVDVDMIEKFRENTPGNYPQAKTDDLLDWLNRHMNRFNQMFADAGSLKRVNYGILEVLDNNAPDPPTDTIYYAIFPFRYRAFVDGDPRGSGYYNPTDDIDYGLLHEEGHQLGMIDLYQMDVAASMNQVSGLGYSAPNGLMRGCSPFISEFHALAMNHWLDKAHGYYGQFMYNLPETIRMRFLGFDGSPLRGATVKVYQVCERPGIGKVITNQIKAQGVTDDNGYFVLPNVPIDQSLVPTIGTGDTLRPNPFGYLAVVGTNGVLHFKVELNGGVDYCWLDVTEPVVAYFKGQTSVATFDRQLALGGAVQHWPPDELTELNANDWSAWAEGSAPGNTYCADDTSRKQVGAGSIKFVTDGGFDTMLRYPRTFTAQWDLRRANTLKFRVYAQNSHSFQNGSPWIRLKDSNGNYNEYQYYSGGYPYDLLNQALNQWKSYEVPIYAPTNTNNGWRRTEFGTPDMAHICSIEFHADTWDYGFTLWYDGVQFTWSDGPSPKGSIRDAKLAPENSRVDIPGAIVSAAWPDVFYIETLDRTSGIRVEKSGHTLQAGNKADIIGLVKTNDQGERMIDASWASAVEGSGVIKPLLMQTKSVGGSDFYYSSNPLSGQQGVYGGIGLNNIGLLIRTWGIVVDRNPNASPAWYVLDDGSGVRVRVIVPQGGSVPALNTFASVTGVSSCYKEGGLLYPRVLAK